LHTRNELADSLAALINGAAYVPHRGKYLARCSHCPSVDCNWLNGKVRHLHEPVQGKNIPIYPRTTIVVAIAIWQKSLALKWAEQTQWCGYAEVL